MSRYLRLTRGQPGRVDARGLEPLRLALWAGGREVDHMVVYSGAPGAQVFRPLAAERPGRNEPIPEGVYRHLGEVELAGGPGDWQTLWPEVASPLWITIYPQRAIGFHLDGNRQASPGSAGCVVTATLADTQRLARWWEDGRPERLEVDWGLGTVSKPAPAAKPAPARHRVLAWVHPGGSRVRIPVGLIPGDYAIRYVGGVGGAASVILEAL